ncbi:MAG: OmpA family protein, partial [bacterium]|nr:OmpA family protein [bacterium]
VAAAVLFAGIYALTGWIRETRRWDAYLASLRDEPGIVVTSAGASGGSYYIAGLRDPLSSDPIGLADAAGLDSDDLRFAWEPYHSSHPAFAAVRELELRTRLVEEQRVHFTTNSSEVSADQLDTISATVARIKALLSAAAAAGSEVKIEISGGADPRGASDHNLELADTRAGNLRALLIERGIEPSRLVLADLKSVQTSQQGDTDLEHAFARVVSFRVLRSQP